MKRMTEGKVTPKRGTPRGRSRVIGSGLLSSGGFFLNKSAGIGMGLHTEGIGVFRVAVYSAGGVICEAKPSLSPIHFHLFPFSQYSSWSLRILLVGEPSVVMATLMPHFVSGITSNGRLERKASLLNLSNSANVINFITAVPSRFLTNLPSFKTRTLN